MAISYVSRRVERWYSSTASICTFVSVRIDPINRRFEVAAIVFVIVFGIYW